MVFERACARCHKLNGLGQDVGPDLATVRNRAPQHMLSDIIMPSASIAQNYESYVVETDIQRHDRGHHERANADDDYDSS